MMRMNKYIFLVISLTICSCNSENSSEIEYKIIALDSPVKASLRGLSPVNDSIAWISGNNGTWIRTLDGGESWEYGSYSDSLDFRDVHAFSADKAIVMNAGYPGLLLLTEDGGDNWNEVYRNETEGVFFDDLSFWNDLSGVMYGDEIDGKLQIAITQDGGQSWDLMEEEHLPNAVEGEGGFAASGSIVLTPNLNSIYISTTNARFIFTTDLGRNWKYLDTNIDGSKPAAGIFSMDLSEDGTLLLVGGDYLEPELDTLNYAWSGKDFVFQSSGTPPAGYRSSVAFIPGTNSAIATGPGGTDISFDNGQNWELLDSVGYHAVKYGPRSNIGWMSGSEGRIALIKMVDARH